MSTTEKPKTEVNILVVDDCTPMRYMVTQLLKKLTHYKIKIFQAKNGREALIKVGQFGDLDLIFVDWHMAEMDGIQFVRHFRQELKGKTPVIMLTIEDRKEKILSAIKSGINDYLIKPVSLQKLQEKLAKHLGGPPPAPQKKTKSSGPGTS